MRTILVLTLYSSVFLFSQSLNGSSRQAPSEDKQEKRGKWKVVATVHKSEGSVSSEFSGKNKWGFSVSSHSEQTSDGTSASVVFTYEPVDEKDKPTPLSTTCTIKDATTGSLTGSLNAVSGSKFNLFFTHTRGLVCSQKRDQKIYFKKEVLFNSLPYDIVKNSNTGIQGEINATHQYDGKVLLSLAKDKTEILKGNQNSLVFAPIIAPLDHQFHEEAYSTAKDEGGITYIYTGTVEIHNDATEAITTVNSSIYIVDDSLDYNPKKF